MDEFSQWQLEEMSRQAKAVQAWLSQSTVLDTQRMVAQMLAQPRVAAQLQEVVANLVTVPNDVWAEFVRTAEILEAVRAMTLGVSMQIQATYGEMLTALAGVRLGAGMSLTAAWSEDDAADGVIEERRLTLPVSDNLNLDDRAEAEVIRGELSVTEEDDKLSATAQAIELNTITSTLVVYPLEVKQASVSIVAEASLRASTSVRESVKTLGSGVRLNWDVTIDKDDEGIRSAHFVARDRESRAKLADFVELAYPLMMGESVQVALPSDASARLGQLDSDEPIGMRAKRLRIRVSRLERWERIRQDYYPEGYTQTRIAEIEFVSVVAIKKDFSDMRKCGLLPPVSGKSIP